MAGYVIQLPPRPSPQKRKKKYKNEKTRQRFKYHTQFKKLLHSCYYMILVMSLLLRALLRFCLSLMTEFPIHFQSQHLGCKKNILPHQTPQRRPPPPSTDSDKEALVEVLRMCGDPADDLDFGHRAPPPSRSNSKVNGSRAGGEEGQFLSNCLLFVFF